MKANAKTSYSPGDPIKAKDLNAAARNANRAASQTGATGQYGALFEDFQGTMAPYTVRVVMARAIRDILPDQYEEQNALEVLNKFNTNAVRQIWDEEKEEWFDKNGEELTIAAYEVPVLEGDILPVYFNAASKRWVPLEQRFHEMVEVQSPYKNDDGFYDGYVCRWQNDDREWKRTRACHVLDGNDPTFPTVGPDADEYTEVTE